MRDMQERMKAAIVKAIQGDEAGDVVEAVDKPQWANTGTMYGMVDWDTVVEVRYDFQDGYMGLTVKAPGLEAKVGPQVEDAKGGTVAAWQPDRSDSGPSHSVTAHYLQYTEGERIRAVLGLIREISDEAAYDATNEGPDRQWEEHYRAHSSSITGIIEGR